MKCSARSWRRNCAWSERHRQGRQTTGIPVEPRQPPARRFSRGTRPARLVRSRYAAGTQYPHATAPQSLPRRKASTTPKQGNGGVGEKFGAVALLDRGQSVYLHGHLSKTNFLSVSHLGGYRPILPGCTSNRASTRPGRSAKACDRASFEHSTRAYARRGHIPTTIGEWGAQCARPNSGIHGKRPRQLGRTFQAFPAYPRIEYEERASGGVFSGHRAPVEHSACPVPASHCRAGNPAETQQKPSRLLDAQPLHLYPPLVNGWVYAVGVYLQADHPTSSV